VSLGGGDRLARGARSAVFPSLSHIDQDRWDAIWAEDSESIQKVNTDGAQNSNQVGAGSVQAKSGIVPSDVPGLQ
jgi:hypothetical protein